MKKTQKNTVTLSQLDGICATLGCNAQQLKEAFKLFYPDPPPPETEDKHFIFDSEKDLVSLDKASELMGVSLSTLNRMRKAGTIKTVQISARRQMVRKSDLQEYILNSISA